MGRHYVTAKATVCFVIEDGEEAKEVFGDILSPEILNALKGRQPAVMWNSSNFQVEPLSEDYSTPKEEYSGC